MLNKLNKIYILRKERIQSRLNDFSLFYNQPVSWFYSDNKMTLQKVNKKDNDRLFEELVFCLLTANTSAEMSMKAVVAIRDVLVNGSLKEIQLKLKEVGYRFPNKRAEYIIEARQKKFDLKNLIESKDKQELREFFVENVKGLGYKEASHFLRNIGVFGLAILDKHVLKSLNEFNVITKLPKSMNKNKYLYIEKKYFEFSKQIKINEDELDLLLWSIKNGQIMKWFIYI